MSLNKITCSECGKDWERCACPAKHGRLAEDKSRGTQCATTSSGSAPRLSVEDAVVEQLRANGYELPQYALIKKQNTGRD